MKYSLEQLQALASSVGFPDPALAAAVAMAESGGNSCAQGDPLGAFNCDSPNGTSTSFGLWQVNTPANPQYDAKSLLDAQYNARAALAISKNGTYWTPWTTYRTGAYKKWYPFAVKPPGGGSEFYPPQISPPSKKAAKWGIGLIVAAAAAYGLYKILPSWEPEPLPPPEPEPAPRRRHDPSFRYDPP